MELFEANNLVNTPATVVVNETIKRVIAENFGKGVVMSAEPFRAFGRHSISHATSEFVLNTDIIKFILFFNSVFYLEQES